MLKFIKKFRELIWYGSGLFLVVFMPVVIIKQFFLIYTVIKAKKGELFAFGTTDASFRVWYDKIARDFYRYGRSGYSWDDGLGLALGARAYNNYATYRLVRAFGQPKLAVLGYFLWSAVVLFLALQTTSSLIWFVAACLPFSPLVIQLYTQLNKPELFWWFLVPVIVYFGLSKFALAAGLLWSLLAMVNAPSAFLVAVSIMVSIFLAQLFVLNSIYLSSMLLLGSLPGGIKLLLRFLYMKQSGYLTVLVNEQQGLWRRGFLNLGNEFITYGIFSLSIWCSVSNSGYGLVFFIVMVFPAVLIYYLNWRLIFINDQQSFLMLFVVYTLGFACYSQSVNGFFVGALLTLSSMWMPVETIKKRGGLNWKEQLSSAVHETINTYPYKKIIDMKSCNNDPLVSIFDTIPADSRILVALDDRLRLSEYRGWVEASRFKLVEKNICLINDIYGCMQTNRLDDIVCNITDDAPLTKSANRLLSLLSIDYVVSLGEKEFRNVGKKNGFSVIRSCDSESIFYQKKTKIGLFEFSSCVGPMEMDDDFLAVKPIIEHDYVTFEVSKTGQYIIPYVFNSCFCLRDNTGTTIDIQKARVEELTDVDLCMADLQKTGKYRLSSMKQLWPRF